jgi:hypothetical protein
MVPLGESHTSKVSFLVLHRQIYELTLLQLELFNTGLIGGDGGTLDTNTVLLDGLGGLNSDLVIGLVTVLDTEIVVLKVDIKVRQNQLSAG